MAVVAQHLQPVIRDFRIGAVQIGDLDRPALQRAIRQIVIQPGRGLRQCIRRAHARPAIGALHEFVAQADRERWMRRQIRHRGDAERLRTFNAHAESIGVLEAERIGHRQPARVQCGAQFGLAGLGQLQQFLRQRAGVFGVGVDLPGLQRAPQDARATELRAVLHVHAVALPGGGGDLAQQHGLGEVLRADRHLRGLRTDASDQQCNGEQHARAHAASPMLRCAVRKRCTNGSAGCSSRLRALPCCTTWPARISTRVSAR